MRLVRIIRLISDNFVQIGQIRMPSFSKKSLSNLYTCHNDIIAVCNEAIIVTDFSVLQGHRPQEEQFELFKKGREYVGGKWVIRNPNLVVTYKDGFEKRGYHNADPSDAVDLAPYPIDWKDIKRFYYLAGAFIAVAYRLRVQGIISSVFTWGGHWKNFKDYPHFQRKDLN